MATGRPTDGKVRFLSRSGKPLAAPAAAEVGQSQGLASPAKVAAGRGSLPAPAAREPARRQPDCHVLWTALERAPMEVDTPAHGVSVLGGDRSDRSGFPAARFCP